jgi:hypothetical protein
MTTSIRGLSHSASPSNTLSRRLLYITTPSPLSTTSSASFRAYISISITLTLTLSRPSIRSSMIWPLAVTIIVIPLAYNSAALRKGSISKAYTSISIARGSYYINSSALNENRVNIRLALSNNLANYNMI